MLFTVSNASITRIRHNGHHVEHKLAYTLVEANGSVFKVKRSASVIGHGGTRVGWDIHGTPDTYAAKAARFENIDRNIPLPPKKTRNGRVIPASTKTWKVVSKVVISAPAAPYQELARALQTQLNVAMQTITLLRQAIAQQNGNIATLKTQTQVMQATIDSLNASVASLRTQVAAIPALQAQVTALEGQIAALRAILLGILAKI